MDSNFIVIRVRFSQKQKIIHFQKNMIIFQSKASTIGKGRLYSLLANFDISPTKADIFSETHVHFSGKHLGFKKNVIIFQSKASSEKRKTVLTSNYTLTYHKQRLIFAEKDM